MFTRPPDLADSAVAAGLAEGWAVEADQISYAAVGFGSHHWRVVADGVRWFVTVDDVEARQRAASETRHAATERLTAALATARTLHDAGLDFVVSPVPDLSGRLLRSVGGHFVMALYPYVEGTAHEWGPFLGRRERLDVVDRIVAIHRSTDRVRGISFVDDHLIPRRHELEAAMADRCRTWGPGPYGEPAGLLVEAHTDALRSALGRYDELVRLVGDRAERVVTHGEPHRGNTITTVQGTVMIDWDTTLLAPPERDLWSLIGEDPSMADAYTERSGVAVDHDIVGLYRLWWDLCEIALFVDGFRQPHADHDDTRTAWRGLVRHLDPRRWSPIP